ncbi:MAG: translocation/assembly module TamB domain-containing protein [Rhodocyclaceae bacterium]
MLVVLATPCVFLGWLLATESGLRSAAAWAPRLTDGQVVVEGARGRLLGPLRIDTVRLERPDLRLRVEALDLAWQPSTLLDRELRVRHLTARHVLVASAPGGEAEDAALALPPPVSLPIRVQVDAVSVERFELHDWAAQASQGLTPGGTLEPLFAVDRFRVGLASDGRVHRLVGLTAGLPFGEASLDGQVDSGDAAFPLDVTARLVGTHDGRDFDLRVQLDGPAAELRARLQASGAGLDGRAEAALAPFETIPLRSLSASLGEIDPSAFHPDAPSGAFQIEAELRSEASDRWALAGPVRVSNRLPAGLDAGGVPLVALSAELDLSLERIEVSDLALSLPEQGRIGGTLAWTPDAAGDSFGRLVADLVLEGVRTRAIDATLPDAVVAGRIEADGNERGQSARIALSVGDASIEADGRFSLAEVAGDPARFELKGRVARFDPSVLVAESPPADLNLHFEANGELDLPAEVPDTAATEGDAPDARVAEGGLPLRMNANWTFEPSRIDGLALGGRGRLTLEGERVRDADLRVELAGNRLDLKGSWGTASDVLSFALDASSLGALQHGFDGVLRAEGKLSGTRQRPTGEVQVFAETLALPGKVRIASLNAQGRLEAGLDGPVGFALGLSGLGPAGDQPAWVETLTLAVSGQRDRHELTLQLATPDDDTLELALAGALLEGSTATSGAAALDGARWRGQLARLELGGRLPLRLLAPAGLSVARERVVLEAAEFDAGENGRVNLLETVWSPDEIALRGQLTGLTVDLVAREARSARSRTGPLSLGAEWDLRLREKASGQARVFRESGDLRIPGELSARIGLERFEARLNAVDNRLAVSVEASGSEFGQLSGSLTALAEKTADGGWQLAPDAALLGSARFEMPSIAWLSRLMQEDIELGGSLAADFSFSGTPANPLASGRLSGRALSVVLVEHGLRLSGGELLAEFDRDRLRLTRLEFVSPNRVTPDDRRLPVQRFTAEPGRLQADGEILLDSGDGSFRFLADRLPILQRVDRWMILSGSGQAESTWTSLALNADFAVDTGYIEFAESPAPSLSDDVVIIGDEPGTGAGAGEGGLKLSADVTVRLGDQLYLSALGLDTRLTGELQVRLRDGEPLAAIGTVSTVGGVFQGYGQNLTIERGLINFQGPLDNPGLNVVALRKGLPVEAGISVGGSARRPQIRLVSEPDVPDPEKLSWIVLGRAPTAGASGEMGLLVPAAQALLGAGGMSDQLTRGLGLDEFGIGQGELGTTSRAPTSRVVGGGSVVTDDGAVSGQVLTVGKRLSSDMFLSFEQSLGGAESLVKLTYQLGRRVSVVVRGGTDTSADVYYTVSFR